jgi:hypothetical protein
MRESVRTIPVRAILLLMAAVLAIALPIRFGSAESPGSPVGTAVLAQTSGNYDLSWHVVAGGGGQMVSAAYTLTGTTGQAGADLMASDSHSLGGGFWAGMTPGGATYAVYLPLMLNH